MHEYPRDLYWLQYSYVNIYIDVVETTKIWSKFKWTYKIWYFYLVSVYMHIYSHFSYIYLCINNSARLSDKQ